MKTKTILAIETSCDETAISIVECDGGIKSPKFKILENLISSQIAIHRPFGGVVPNLAKREHLKNLPILYKKITNHFPLNTINYIAVTVGPGLEPALWTGIEFAKKISAETKKPLIGVNHMEGHIYSNWLPRRAMVQGSVVRKNKKLHPQPYTLNPIKMEFPAIALIASGGHTTLLKMKSLSQWQKLGETLDDAAGEAFDKVAKMLSLPYPGGPEIQKLAEKGNPAAIKFPRPMLHPPAGGRNNYDFSFSGLKTSVLYYLRDNPKAKKASVAASFQEAVVDVLNKKTEKAAIDCKAKTIFLCGGVSANKPLKNRLNETAKKLKINFSAPDNKFNTDNAAMIAAAAYIAILKKKKLPLEAQGNLPI